MVIKIKCREIIAKKLMSDSEIEKKEGNFCDEKCLKKLIKDDCDVYRLDDQGNKILLAKFRKKVIPEDKRKIGFDSFCKLTKPSRGRGPSAGPINPNSKYWGKRKVSQCKSKWMTYQVLEDGKLSKMQVSNPVISTPLGYTESNGLGNLPCRLTHFTRKNFDTYKSGLPFIEEVDSCFKTLTPEAYKKQRCQANKRKDLRIKNTAFSTITVNRNFRTALHKDSGDFKQGFGNLSVIERGKYSGGYTIFPQYGVGFDVRNGDFLAMDVHEWHANTPLYETPEQKKFNNNMEDIFKDNADVGTSGTNFKFTRLTFVCYLRGNLVHCADKIDTRYLEGGDGTKIVPMKKYSKIKPMKKSVSSRRKTQKKDK
jgi:hypothetical protein